VATGFGRRGASLLHNQLLALPISRIAEAGQDVFFRQVGKIRQDLLVRHPGSEVGEHIVDGNTHSSDARLSPALARFDGYDVLILHGDSISVECRLAQESSRMAIVTCHSSMLFSIRLWNYPRVRHRGTNPRSREHRLWLPAIHQGSESSYSKVPGGRNENSGRYEGVCTNMAEEWAAFVLVRNLDVPPRRGIMGPADLVFNEFTIWDGPQGNEEGRYEAFRSFPKAYNSDYVYDRRYASIPPAREAAQSDYGAIPEDVEDALLLLRLFKPGDLAFAQFKIQDPHGELYDQLAWRLISNATPGGIPYQISPEECTSWDHFASELKCKPAWHSPWFRVARRFFLYGGAKEFKCRKGPGEVNEADRIVDYMIALEATLAPEKDDFISRRLRERAVKLLGRQGEQADNTRDLLNGFYGLRSRIAHGSPLSDADRDFIEKNKEDFEHTIRGLLIEGLRKLPPADRDRTQILARWWAPSDAERAQRVFEDFGRIKNSEEKRRLVERLSGKVGRQR